MNRLVTMVAVAVAVVLGLGVVRAQTGKAPSTAEQAPSREELQRLVKAADTPAEHATLSEYYLKAAERMEQEAADYEKLAKSYEYHANSQGSNRRKGVSLFQGARHCRNLAAFARKAATEDRALASLHAEAATKTPRP